MYEPHLSSAFIAYKPKAFSAKPLAASGSPCRTGPQTDLIKQCEVGLPALRARLKLESLYTHNANGNVLHYDWKN